MSSTTTGHSYNYGKRVQSLISRVDHITLDIRQFPIELSVEAQDLLDDLLNSLHAKPRGRNEVDRLELKRNYINILVLQLNLNLLFLRWHAESTLYSALTPAPLLTSDLAIVFKMFDKGIARLHQRLSALNYHALVVAFRVWADEFSPIANTSPGWIEIAPNCTQELRYRYNIYRTRELLALIREGAITSLPRGLRTRRQGKQRWPLLMAALPRLIYEVVAGYGLRLGRFVISFVSIITFYSAIYWIIDWRDGCFGLQNGVEAFVHRLFWSLGIFTTVGTVTSSPCSIQPQVLQDIASSESLTGYLLLGILISIFWVAFHDVFMEVSSIRIRGRTTSIVDSEGEQK